jgi:hypothetical protein
MSSIDLFPDHRISIMSGRQKDGLRTFISPSLVDSDQYWHHVAAKCFTLSTKLGPPTFCLTFTMNRHQTDDKAFKRGDETLDDSAIVAIIFKTKPAIYPSKMSFMRAIPSPTLRNCSIVLPFRFRLHLNVSLAFVDIGPVT